MPYLFPVLCKLADRIYQMSLFFAAQAVTVLQWSRLSDRVGRKSVLLCGPLGTIFSSLLFGLSRSSSALVSRYIRPQSTCSSLHVTEFG
jgi:MFS family permease